MNPTFSHNGWIYSLVVNEIIDHVDTMQEVHDNLFAYVHFYGVSDLIRNLKVST